MVSSNPCRRAARGSERECQRAAGGSERGLEVQSKLEVVLMLGAGSTKKEAVGSGALERLEYSTEGER